MLEVGQPAPPFSLQSDTDETVSLDDLQGRPVVVYFYPKDDTPGCTPPGLQHPRQLGASSSGSARP